MESTKMHYVAAMASSQMVEHRPTMGSPPWARLLFLVNAVVAWCSVVLSGTLHLSGYYLSQIDPMQPTLLGNVADGVDNPLKRFFDWITYFTVWSNITVAIVLTVLVLRPGLFTRTDRIGSLWRTLRLDSVLMIAVTGIVFNLLLATGDKQGWDLVSNTLQHVATPILTVAVWILAGPRGLIAVRTVFASLILPLIWVVFALVRGTVIGAYPYPFLDVATNGWASVLTFVAGILLFGIVLAFIFLGVDRVIMRFLKRPT